MAETKPPRPGAAPQTRAPGKLIVTMGLVAAAIVAPFVSTWESGGKQHLTPYRDIVGVWTVCDGDTANVTPGKAETAEGCAIRLDTRLAGFAQAVVKRNPELHGHDNQWAAATSLAYNIGVTGYAGSTVARRFSAGDWRGACNAFALWNKARGKVVQGLVNRRAAERALCLKGLV